MYYEEGDIHSDITDLCWWCKYDNICWIQHNMKNAMSLLPACCNADLDVTQVFLERMGLRSAPEDWSGIWTMTTK